ncbi:hypothetical protein VZT92_023758 [Zoarces viviparus]|uniref:Uncharacterized protein n=1 Tax=Zoarces viviparus TaxID=48416 RepID=A0AAW1E8D0_ZOAVI
MTAWKQGMRQKDKTDRNNQMSQAAVQSQKSDDAWKAKHNALEAKDLAEKQQGWVEKEKLMETNITKKLDETKELEVKFKELQSENQQLEETLQNENQKMNQMEELIHH